VSILSREEAQVLTQRILGLSHADECRVSLTSGLQANTRFADNGVTTSGDATNDAVVVRSSFGRRSGTASTNILTDEGLLLYTRSIGEGRPRGSMPSPSMPPIVCFTPARRSTLSMWRRPRALRMNRDGGP
jgi:hypothetical protein